MIYYKPENCTDESEIVYLCDGCGNLSNLSDYRRPGHYHWKELDIALCNDCLRPRGARPATPPPPAAPPVS